MEKIINNFVIYSDDKNNIQTSVIFDDKNETIWMTQKSIAEIFDKSTSTISEHISNIFKEGELNEDSVIRNFRTTASDGKEYLTKHYNLDVAIAVGYRAKSPKATNFRKQITKVLNEFMIKGFVIDDERLKGNKKVFGKDYFRDLLERVREIRISERRLYQQVKDLYSLSEDYNPESKGSIFFFARVQDKLHYAIAGHTAKEIVYNRIDSRKENLGLISWAGEKITLQEAKIAKNYLEEKEMKELRLFVNMFLDFAEIKASREEVIYKKDWEDELNRFLEFHKMAVLKRKSTISKEEFENKVMDEYRKFRAIEFEKAEKNSDNELQDDIAELEEIIKKGA